MTPREHYDKIGNAPVLWFESAMDLLMASAEIGRASDRTAKRLRIPQTRSFWPRLMLRAFAVECLIKAQCLISKKKLCIGGKYVGVVKNERHDLTKLAREIGFPLSRAEAHLLDRLSAVSVGSGRYPIFKSFDVPRQSGTNGRLRIQWTRPQDELQFQALLLRLIQPLDTEMQFGALIKEA